MAKETVKVADKATLDKAVTSVNNIKNSIGKGTKFIGYTFDSNLTSIIGSNVDTETHEEPFHL